MAFNVLAEIQSRGSSTNEPRLGCIDALPDYQAQPISPWLDKLFRYR